MKGTYKAVGSPGHPRAHRSASTKTPWRHEHLLIAELALGKLLPLQAHVYHVDENTRNNAPSNLVICEDAAYHKLLHKRARIVRAGGNPNTERVCSKCRRVQPVAAFNRHRADYQTACRACQRIYFAAFWAKRKECGGAEITLPDEKDMAA